MINVAFLKNISFPPETCALIKWHSQELRMKVYFWKFLIIVRLLYIIEHGLHYGLTIAIAAILSKYRYSFQLYALVCHAPSAATYR